MLGLSKRQDPDYGVSEAPSMGCRLVYTDCINQREQFGEQTENA